MGMIRRSQERFQALPAGVKVAAWVVAVVLLIPLPILFWIGTSWSQKAKIGATVAFVVVLAAARVDSAAGIDFVLPTALVVLALAGLVLAVIVGPRYRWTGFRGKTVWDWMQLLGVPLVLAVIGLLFNVRAQEREEERAGTDRLIAVDAQREQTLQRYLDTLTGLMLDRGLPSSTPGDGVRTVARTRTLAVLRQLDGERKGIVAQFLHQSHLVDRDHAVLDMAGADLSHANLSSADLSHADLSDADLRGAQLQESLLGGTDLSGADLQGADLSGAELQGAILVRADLSAAILDTDPDLADLYGVIDLTFVPVELSEANLSDADLFGADLGGADLGGAILARASLRGANLSRDDLCDVGGRPPSGITNLDRRCDPATFFGASLIGADLTDANLRGVELYADLTGAVLGGADLREADLSFAQNVSDANLPGARANPQTAWPEGFDAKSAGVEIDEETPRRPGPPSPLPL